MTQNNTPKKGSLSYLVLLCVNTVILFTVYRVLISYGELTDETFFSFCAMVLYLTLLLGFTVAYLIYNRFFYRHGLTHEQLPEEWSAEKKIAFLEDAERRKEKSKWMITVIFPLVLTFFVDAVDLFIIDTFLRG